MKDYSIGARYGMLTIIGEKQRRPRNNGDWRYYVPVRCDCGKEKLIDCSHLGRSDVKACGCLPPANFKHGFWQELLHDVWHGMHTRCKDKDNPYYGGKGIVVCDEWQDYLPFRVWSLANGYAKGLTIDRIDGNGNYGPDNCRWVTRAENNLNKTQPHEYQSSCCMITAFGETKTAIQWSKDQRCLVTYGTLLRHIAKGWLPERAMTELGKRGRKPK